jgi:hypothetical protein
VTGIRHDELSVIVDLRDHRRGEAIAGQQLAKSQMQTRHRIRRIRCRSRAGHDPLFELLLDHGHDHGRFETLPGHVAEDDPEHAPFTMCEVEVARELARRLRNRVQIDIAR